MPLIINTNVASLDAQRHLTVNTHSLSRAFERLGSGYRINHAGDDAAGLQLSESLRTQIRGEQKALTNVQDGVNFLNLADGALQTITDSLQRIRELTVEAGNDTYSANQRTAITLEIDQLRSEIDQIANSTQFNGVLMLASTGVPTNFYIQIGANSSALNDRIDVAAALGDSTALTGLGLTAASGNIPNNAAAKTYLTTVDAAIVTINTRRASLGSLTNRLNGIANNLSVGVENQSAAESRIRNADVALETSEMNKNQVLQQASVSVLAQANQLPNLALKLLNTN